MDFKVVVAILAVAFSGYMYYQNQQRADMLIELSRKYQASSQQAAAAGVAAVVSDEALMEVIRKQVRAEMAANPIDCTKKGKFEASDAAKFQELYTRVVAFEKQFNKATQDLTDDNQKGEFNEKVAAKAAKIKDKIVALCNKK